MDVRVKHTSLRKTGILNYTIIGTESFCFMIPSLLNRRMVVELSEKYFRL